MRVIYLTLVVFILMGIGATCRTPTLLPADCGQLMPGLADCPRLPTTPGD